MNTPEASGIRPRLGIQGPVVAWQDPWARAASDEIMRTGTGVPIVSQDPTPTGRQFLFELSDLGADFYVHHVVPGEEGFDELLSDSSRAGVDIVLGNEYGNINGPYIDATNRYDVPVDTLKRAAHAGVLAGVLYDEPEHLQINAGQYRHDDFLPHFGATDGMDADRSIATIDQTVREIVRDIDAAAPGTPVLAEHVFPVLFHTLARAGMTPTPKVMKESFQPLQLGTALGASLQYGRDLWICADLWGPDIGPWFTRAPGLPGHSPEEFASALRMAYLFAPTAIFVENVDVLSRHLGQGRFARTEFGEVWAEFTRDFVPRHRLAWSFRDAVADIAIIHAEDSDFGRGERPFGNRRATPPEAARTVFQAWHLISHGSIPAHGSCMHIDGIAFPRHGLDDIPQSDFPLERAGMVATTSHGLFHPTRSVLAFDEHVEAAVLGDPGLILAVGSRMPAATLALLRARADEGATVVIADRLVPAQWRTSEAIGAGRWVATPDLLGDDVREAIAPLLGPQNTWTQRFGGNEVRFAPADATGTALEFEIADATLTGA
jgi:hypothetical protein